MSERKTHSETWGRFISGDQDALLEIYQQHYLGLINYGRTIIDDYNFVNDCFIELLIRLWEKRATLPQVENVRSYLMTSLRRVIFDRSKAEKRRDSEHVKSQSHLDAYQISYEQYLMNLQTNSGLQARIGRALQKLTQRQLELVRMKFFEDLDYDEICERCNITKRTAYNIIHDALTTLKDELNGQENSSFLTDLSMVVYTISLFTELHKIF